MTRASQAPRDKRAPYLQIAADIAEKISDGTLRPGEKLARTADLAVTYGVVEMTVRKALGQLRADGLLTIQHRKGAFVRRPSDPADPGKTRSINYGARLRAARIAAGLSQAEFGDLANLNRASVGFLESGRHQLAVDTAARYAELLGVDPAWLAFGDAASGADRPRPPHTEPPTAAELAHVLKSLETVQTALATHTAVLRALADPDGGLPPRHGVGQ